MGLLLVSLVLVFLCLQQEGKRATLLRGFLIILILTQNGEAFIIKDNEGIHVITHPVLPTGLASVTWDTKALS